MSEKPKRRFRFHLTTAILVTWIFGVLLYFGLRVQPVGFWRIRGMSTYTYTESQGWPIPCFSRQIIFSNDIGGIAAFNRAGESALAIRSDVFSKYHEASKEEAISTDLSVPILAFDVMCVCLIILSISYLFEWAIFRRGVLRE